MLVGNLLPTLTKKDLLNYFSQFGGIEKGIIMTDKLTGKSRGFGFIIFNEKETIDKIMKKGNCHILNGKLIECKRVKPKIQSMKLLHEKEYFPKFNNDNNNTDNFNNNKKGNNEIIVNYSFKSVGKFLLGDKSKFGENLFLYQNYIPKNEIVFLSKGNFNNLQNNKKVISFNNNFNNINNKNNNNNNNNKNIENHPNIKNKINETKKDKKEDLKNQNSNQLNQFQNFFNNQLKNPSSYHFIHFKLYDSSNGEEVSKLSGYKRNNLKIRLFPKELDDVFEKNKEKLNINIKNEIENIENEKKDNLESNDEFGPDRSSCRKGKTRSSIFNNESYKPY